MTDLFERRPPEEPGLDFYASGVPWHLPVPRDTLPDLLDAAAHRYGARTALASRGNRTGFRALRRAAARIAPALSRLGLRRSDHLALLLPDCPEAVVLCHAAWRLGAVVVPGRPSDSRQVLARAVVAAVPRERLGEIAASGDHGFLRAVVTVETEPPRTRRRDARPRTADVPREEPSAGPAGTVAALRPAPHARHIPAQRSGSGGPYGATAAPDARPARGPVDVVAYRDLERRPPDRPGALLDWDWSGGADPDDVAVLVHRRDGTRVLLRHRNLVAAAHQVVAWQAAPAPRRPRLLSLVPLSDTRGIVLVTAALLAGARTVLVPGGGPFAVLKAARRHAPTVLVASPADLRRLLERPAHEREALATVRTVVTAPLDAATGERLRAALDARVVEAYGPAAAAGVALANPPTADARPGTAGLTVPRTRARIAVEGFPDVDVLPGHAGELLLRGPQIGDLPGRPAGGWLRTGLLAVRGPDGFVTLLRGGGGRDAAAPPH
ncbi:AMP-binding protein [Streptomyces sp. XHT-2]|uniref:AMP-binding protein n=1 Tax=Streptomyces sp. XHT-2 TaxID=2692621 RepID=UPI00136AF4D1|nr:AMP-binding protein [Streptomyces sp. XHT-2]WSB47077.1 AMP-binding protein [Streptomyces cellulosae]